MLKKVFVVITVGLAGVENVHVFAHQHEALIFKRMVEEKEPDKRLVIREERIVGIYDDEDR